MSQEPQQQYWLKQLSGYHWLVLIVCTLAWSFDCLNQQLFNLARTPALADLLSLSPDASQVSTWGGWSTSALLIGWATGGIIFGMLGDRIGRVKTLIIMILAYSISTGLCGLSYSSWDYVMYAFITGVGAGGIFPVCCTLLAESLPDSVRPQSLGMMQAFSAFGNVSAAFISLGLLELLARGVIDTHWRWMFSAGIIPALLSIIVFRRLREPGAWLKVMAAGGKKKAGSIIELFRDPFCRPRAIVGLLLAASGVVGLWGIGVFSNDLMQAITRGKFDDAQRKAGQVELDRQFVALAIASPQELASVRDKVEARHLLGADGKDKDAQALYEAALRMPKDQPFSAESVLAALDKPDADRKIQPQAQTDAERDQRRDKVLKAATAGTSLEQHAERIVKRQKDRSMQALGWAAKTLLMFNVGAFFGMYIFARVTQIIGRRPTFALAFIAAAVTTATAFMYMSETNYFILVPLMGAAQLSVFGGYGIYFPELFPTRLRSTGASFCYNVGRYVAATGPLSIAFLKNNVFAHTADPFRYAGVAMCSCFLLGLVALLFAPETKGKPLPE